MSSGTNFLKLKVDEIIAKLQNLADQKEVVKVWRKGGLPSFYRVSDLLVLKSDIKSDVLLSFFSEGEATDSTLIGKESYLSFTFNDIDYFADGTMIKDESHDKIVLRLSGEVYRSEKRDNQRLITFPHHEVYAYFKIISDTEVTNVISINKSDKKSYETLKIKRKESLKEKLSQRVEDTENLVGFRALDISQSGIAFLVTAKEGIHFKDDKKMSFYLLFDEEMFIIKGSQLVYKVNYLGGQDKTERFKIGLTYGPSRELSSFLEKILGEGDHLELARKDFEEFLRK